LPISILTSYRVLQPQAQLMPEITNDRPSITR
jgi:hypothetical protein